MATFYPLTMEDMINISGVNLGKAQKFAKPFLELIKKYVEENEIERPDEIVIRQVANKSRDKVTIIQGIDKKLPFEDIAKSVGITMDDLYEELNIIVDSGTKIDIGYYLEDAVDEDIIEEVFDYFHEAHTDSASEAYTRLKDEDITMEEIVLVRIKFMTEVVN